MDSDLWISSTARGSFGWSHCAGSVENFCYLIDQLMTVTSEGFLVGGWLGGRWRGGGGGGGRERDGGGGFNTRFHMYLINLMSSIVELLSCFIGSAVFSGTRHRYAHKKGISSSSFRNSSSSSISFNIITIFASSF